MHGDSRWGMSGPGLGPGFVTPEHEFASSTYPGAIIHQDPARLESFEMVQITCVLSLGETVQRREPQDL